MRHVLLKLLYTGSVAHDHHTSVAVVAVHTEGRMDELRFQVGDRVMLRVAWDKFRVGMLGTVRRVFLSVDDVYDVLFDGERRLVAMRGRELEPLEQAQEWGA
jgi:hypothetical protein